MCVGRLLISVQAKNVAFPNEVQALGGVKN